MLGPDLLVSPVTAPRTAPSNLATRAVWLPPGRRWYEMGTGALLQGGRVLEKGYDLTEIPIFVRAGAVVASSAFGYGEPLGKAVASTYSQLTFTVYPGTATGSGYSYDDDGLTDAYLTGSAATTTLSYTRNATAMRLTISRNGSFPQIETEVAAAPIGPPLLRPQPRSRPTPSQSRVYHIAIVSSLPPTKVTAQGTPVLPRRTAAQGSAAWRYDGPSVTLHVTTARIDLGKGPYVLELRTPPVDDIAMSGLKGIFSHSNLAKESLDQVPRVLPPKLLPPPPPAPV